MVKLDSELKVVPREESQLHHFSNYDVATLITASSVAFIGVISFIGLYKQKVN